LSKDDSPFFVLNSDVICEFPFAQLLSFHQSHGCEGTLMTTPVEDPTKYGVVCLRPNTTIIDKFVEKPQTFVGNQINAGIYIFNPKVLSRIHHVFYLLMQNKPMSIEKEVFPKMAQDCQLHAIPLHGFWADVGQPKDFLIGTALYLQSQYEKQTGILSTANYCTENNLVDPTAKIGAGCKIGPNAVIGANCIIGPGVRIANSVVMSGAVIKDYSWINNSIVGWHSSVGRWSRLDNTTVLGEDVHVKDEIYVNGATVLPHKSVASSILAPQIVM
jgi:mannose-1-phosphate guanylyltransferase